MNADVANAVRSMHRLHKPIGALCIAPVVIARILGGVTVTIGKDAATVKEIETLGARHQMALQTQVVVDEKNMIFSTPCYMLDATIVDIAEGAKAIVSEMLKWI